MKTMVSNWMEKSKKHCYEVFATMSDFPDDIKQYY